MTAPNPKALREAVERIKAVARAIRNDALALAGTPIAMRQRLDYAADLETLLAALAAKDEAKVVRALIEIAKRGQLYDHMLDVAKANGFDSLTDAIALAKRPAPEAREWLPIDDDRLEAADRAIRPGWWATYDRDFAFCMEGSRRRDELKTERQIQLNRARRFVEAYQQFSPLVSK